MTTEKKMAIAFNHLINFNNFKLQTILKNFSSLEKAYYASDLELYKLPWRKKIIETFLNNRKKIKIEKIIKEIEEQKIMVSYIKEDSYPELLRNIYDPPPILYYWGDLKIDWNKSLSVIGSRHPSSYGQRVVKNIITELSDSGLNIISGLAIGIDSLAHEESLLNNLKTIAVLGSGLGQEVIHPKSNRRLVREIIDNQGLVVSEFSPRTPPWPQNFPQRNRIIAGLSNKTLVIEAGEKSGSLITSKLALEEGRDVLTIVGDIFSLNSKGTNELAKNGAIIVNQAEDILNLFNIDSKKLFQKSTTKIKTENKIEEKIIELLKKEKKNIEEIIAELQENISEILTAINSLEIKGYIKDLGGKNYVLR
ncbi:MAG: DNA-processing protein DprA [Patescibacteria group bacterium]|nr:DNA-processing protein DprA [Patescibacteria group bacterium]